MSLEAGALPFSRIYLKLGPPGLVVLMASVFELRARLPCCNMAIKLPWPIRMARGQDWKVILAAMCLVGGADVLTGDVIWFGPAYLLIIGAGHGRGSGTGPYQTAHLV